jgi:hypothetical protein
MQSVRMKVFPWHIPAAAHKFGGRLRALCAEVLFFVELGRGFIYIRSLCCDRPTQVCNCWFCLTVVPSV